MEKLRELIKKAVTGIGIAVFVCFGMIMYDRGENAIDKERDSYYGAESASYMGDVNTLVFHSVEYGYCCVKQIGLRNIEIIGNKAEAEEMGYSPCQTCMVEEQEDMRRMKAIFESEIAK